MRFTTQLAAVLFIASLGTAASAGVLKVPDLFPSIQAAVNAAQPGDTVRVEPNAGADPIYHEYVHINTSNITLEGVDDATMDGTGLGHTDPNWPGYTIGDNGITVTADRVVIKGMTIQNYADTVVSTGLPLLAEGIYMQDNYVMSVANCTVRSCGDGMAIFPFGVPGTPTTITITENTVSNCVHGGIGVTSGFGDIDITKNTVTGCGEFGIGFGPGDTPTVEHNVVTYCGALTPSTGAILDGASGPAADPGAGEGLVAHNDCTDNFCAGIYVAGADHQTIDHNDVERNQGGGILVDISTFITVEHNTVSNCSLSGVAIFDFSSACTIAHNDVDNNTGGGYFNDVYSTGSTFQYNSGSGNGPYDAEDDTSPIANTWSENHFGTTLPSNLSSP